MDEKSLLDLVGEPGYRPQPRVPHISGWDALLVLVGFLLSMDSFLPWYGAVQLTLRNGYGTFDERALSAWSSSSAWSAALALSLVAAFGRLVHWLARRHTAPAWVSAALAATAAAGLVTAILSWLAMPAGPPGPAAPLRWELRSAGDPFQGAGGNQVPGGDAYVLWGFDCGILLMAAIVVILAIVAVRTRHPRVRGRQL